MTSPIRTLIVDDDPAVRRLHTSYLSGLEGFVLVDAVGSAAAAVEVAVRDDVDLVLLDINLPGFSGVEVLHRLREIRGGEVDVYVVSSARDRATVRQAISARIVGFLAKPFTREAFEVRMAAYREARPAGSARSPETEVPLGQGEIDDLLSSHATAGRPVRTVDAPAEGEPLPKGIARPTLDRIRAALDPWHPVTAKDIVQTVGAAPATVRRYLDHLVRTGEADVSHRFGRRGRPEVLYRLAPPAR